jgi:hypothetical protein
MAYQQPQIPATIANLKVAHSKRIGRRQANFLCAIAERGSWHQFAGWTWGGVGATERLAMTLVKRKMLVAEPVEFPNRGTMGIIYRITPSGRAMARHLSEAA